MPLHRNTPERVLAKAVKDEKTGCLVWPTTQRTRSRNDVRPVKATTTVTLPTGEKKHVQVVRYLWDHHVSPLRPDQRLENLCGNNHCVWWEHHRILGDKSDTRERADGKKSSMSRRPSSMHVREQILFFIGASDHGLSESVLRSLVAPRRGRPIAVGTAAIAGVEPGVFNSGNRKALTERQRLDKDVTANLAKLEREGVLSKDGERWIIHENGGRSRK